LTAGLRRLRPRPRATRAPARFRKPWPENSAKADAASKGESGVISIVSNDTIIVAFSRIAAVEANIGLANNISAVR